MNWTLRQIASEAGFQSISQFSNESHRNGIPFNPRKRGVENRYGVADLAIAICLRHLRRFGVPTARAAGHLQTLDRTALEAALDALTDGRVDHVIVGLPTYDLDLLPEGWTGVFLTPADVAAAIADTDVLAVDVGAYVKGHIGGGVA